MKKKAADTLMAECRQQFERVCFDVASHEEAIWQKLLFLLCARLLGFGAHVDFIPLEEHGFDE